MRERFKIKFDEKNNLVGYKWIATGKIKGIVQIAHGLSEHVTRYDEFAQFLNKYGYNVIAFDHYHHGESVEELTDLGIIEEYDFITAIVRGIKLVRETYKEDFIGTKILFSHSMGSISTQTYIQQYPYDFDKVILSGTDVGDIRYAFLKFLTSITTKKNDYRTSTKLVHNLTFGNFEKKFKEKSTFNWLSKNPDNIKNYELDPLCGAPVSDKTYKSIATALRTSFKTKNIQKINKDIQLFIFSGAEDPVSDFGKSVQKLYQKYKKANLDVTMKLYPTLRHETLNELEKQQVFDDILQFIEK